MSSNVTASPDAARDPAAAPTDPGRLRFALFAGLAGVVTIADQITKVWVDSTFELAWTRSPAPGLADPTPILGDFVRIAKSYNDGGLFGLFGASAPVLAAVSLAVIGVLVFVQARGGASAPLVMTIALGLLLGGALGNFADRIRLGFVVDFVDMGWGDVRWFAFNVADAALSVAIVGLLLSGFFPRTFRADGDPAR